MYALAMSVSSAAVDRRWFLSSRDNTVNTARAAAAFVLMFNIMENNKILKREVHW
jgi:hypothetical protein